MGKESVFDQIQQLDLLREKRGDTIRELNSQKADEEKELAKLESARCDLLSTIIFSDLHKLIVAYLKVQETYKAFRDKIVEYGDHKPSLFERAKTDSKHDFWLVVADGCLKPGDIRDSDFGSFMKKVLSLTKDLAKKEGFPFPGLHR